MMPIYLRSTPAKAKRVATPKRVFWQQGDFTIEQGENQTQTIDPAEGGYRFVIQDTVWKKSDIPFGTAALHTNARLVRDGFPDYTWIYRLSLIDHGTNAKSKLPEGK